MSPVRSRPLLLALRLLLGAVFVYLGVVKALDPVGFLKLVRQFDVVTSPPGLNLIAALLPWFEIVCGACLIVGWKARGAALVQALLLLAFTVLVAARAYAIHAAGGTPYCAIRFDCGCGTGEVLVCLKVPENLALLALALVVAFAADPAGTEPAGERR